MLYIGIDLGTSAVKLLLMDGAGKIQKIVSKEYPLYFPNPGWSEQNPEDWYDKSIEGLKELLADCDRSQVAGISFGGSVPGYTGIVSLMVWVRSITLMVSSFGIESSRFR